MLPTEAFAEAVAFLRLFDLSALAVTNAMCSSLAVKASTAIRWEDFRGFTFLIRAAEVLIVRRNDATMADELVTTLSFRDLDATAAFIAAALPYCIVDQMVISRIDLREIYQAVYRVADSVVVKRALRIPDPARRVDSRPVVRKFRSVEALELRVSGEEGDNELNEIASFYRGSGVKEVHFYRRFGSTTKKITLI